MNSINGDAKKIDHGSPHGPDRKVKLLLALLVILGATLVFLATPLSERTLGIKLSSLFSNANLSQDSLDGFKVEDLPPAGGGGFSGGTEPVFNCVVAPCIDPNWSIVNPEPNTVWKLGEKVKISWNGSPRLGVANIRASTFSLSVAITGQDCNNTRLCYADYEIVKEGIDNGTYVWEIPKNLPEHLLNRSLDLILVIDGVSKAQTTVQIVNKIGDPGDQYPDGTFIRLLSNPNMVVQLTNGTKRQLPYPSEEVITCLGGNPANIKNGLAIHERIPFAEPLFCNPTALASSPIGSLISGLPDSDVTSIYLVQKGVRRPFPTGKIFECLGYSYNNVHIANSKDAKLPIGAPMTCNNDVSRLYLTGDGTLPKGSVNTIYSTKITAQGGRLPYTFSIVSTQPSVKVKIESDGQLTAKFTTPGTYQIRVRVVDSGSQPGAAADTTPQSDEKTYTVVIAGLTTTGGGGGGGTTAQNCTDGPIQSLVAVYRYYSSRDTDHYYSTNATAPSGYVSEGITAYVYPSPVAGTVAVYQSYNSERKDHYYTTDQEGAQTYGYKLDGMLGYVYPTQVAGSSPLYRMYNNSASHYLMTASTVERDAINGLGFVQQGTIGYTCGTSRPGSEIIPVYRLWNSKLTDHFYTTDVSERDAVMKRGYVSEGIMGNMYSVPGPDRVGVQRLWSAKYGDHFYTTSEAEAVASKFSREGVIGFIKISPSNTVSQLYRLNNTKIGDHFYTTSATERDAVVKGGYKFEGTMGYLP